MLPDPPMAVLPAERRPLVLLALGCGVMAISFAAVLFRLAQPVHPLLAACVRLVVASLLLLPAVVRARRQGRLSARHLAAGALGGLCYGLHFGSWVWSLDLTSVAASVTLVTVTPLFLALHGWLTGHDRPNLPLWLALAVASSGILVITGHDLFHSAVAWKGDLLALLGAITMAGYLLVVRRQGPALDAWAFMGVATMVGAVSLAVTAGIAGIPFVPPTGAPLTYLIASAILPQLVGHGCLTWAVRHVAPTQVALATLAEPIGASLLAWLWLGETIGWQIGIGGLIVLVGVALGLSKRS